MDEDKTLTLDEATQRKNIYRDREQLVIIKTLNVIHKDGNCILSSLCRSISTNRGFRDVPIGHDDAFAARSLIHIAGEILEWEEERAKSSLAQRIEQVVSELADMVILVADMLGPSKKLWLDKITYNCRLPMDENLSRQLGRMMQQAYKRGFASPEFMLETDIFLNSVACFGAHYAGGNDKFQEAILYKCERNIRREVRYGVPK